MNSGSFRQKIELKWFDAKDQPLLESYICKMCLGIFINPVLLTCGDVFCKYCFISNDSKCINKGEKCNKAAIHLENMPFIQPPIQDKSCHCKNIGCSEIIPAQKLFEHFNICPKELIKCKYGCQTQDSRERLQEHEQGCLWRDSHCLDCSETIVFKDLELHQSLCPMKTIHCVLCNEPKLRKSMSQHLTEECVEYQQECPYSRVICKETFKKKDLSQHYESNHSAHIRKYSEYLFSVKGDIENCISQYRERKDRPGDYFNKLLSQIEQYKSTIQLNDDLIEEDEEKEMSIEQNNYIESPVDNYINDNNEDNNNGNANGNEIENDKDDDDEEEESRKIFRTGHIVNRRKGNRRAKGLRTYPNKKNQIEYQECLILNKTFLTTSTIQVKNCLLTAQSNLSAKELKHSPFHIIIYSKHLYEDSSWIVNAVSINKLFYFGVCVKEVVSNSNAYFDDLKGNHGFFGISSQGFQFHSYSSFKNNRKISKPLQLGKDIGLTFFKDKNQLTIRFSTQDSYNQEIEIPNVVAYCSEYSIVPCLLLTEKDDQVKFECKSPK